MLTLGERIKHIRERKKAKQSDFAILLGFSRIATISDYEKNKRNPDIETLCKIAEVGGVSLDWLLTGTHPAGGEKQPASVSETAHPVYREEYASIEVYSAEAISSAKVLPKENPIGAISIPARDNKKDLIAVRIDSDSMHPTILAGSIVGIDTSDRHLLSGKLYAVRLSYEGATIKRIFVYPDRILLKPDNPSFPETAIPVSAADDDFIIGRVKWAYQRY